MPATHRRCGSEGHQPIIGDPRCHALRGSCVASGFHLEEGANLVGIFLQQPQPGIHRTVQISHVADQGSTDAVVLDVIPDQLVRVNFRRIVPPPTILILQRYFRQANLRDIS
jgi:hypothetical protein